MMRNHTTSYSSLYRTTTGSNETNLASSIVDRKAEEEGKGKGSGLLFHALTLRILFIFCRIARDCLCNGGLTWLTSVMIRWPYLLYREL